MIYFNFQIKIHTYLYTFFFCSQLSSESNKWDIINCTSNENNLTSIYSQICIYKYISNKLLHNK